MVLSRYRKIRSKNCYSLNKKKQSGGTRELFIIYIYKIDKYWPIIITKNKSLIYAYLHNLNRWFDRNPSRYREHTAPYIRLSKITQNEDYTVSSPNFEKIDFKDYLEETDDLDWDPMDEKKYFIKLVKIVMELLKRYIDLIFQKKHTTIKCVVSIGMEWKIHII